MPELPEVETIKEQLKKSLIGRKIEAVFVYMDKMVKVGPGKISNIKKGSVAASRAFTSVLKAKKILDVSRRAKYLIIKLSGKVNLIIHLRMSGQLIYLTKSELKNPLLLSLAKTAVKNTLPTKHTHVEFVFADKSKLFYNDTRQFGHIRLVTDPELLAVIEQGGLGPEPLELTLKEFLEIISAHPEKRAKDFLLNQEIVAGIGNIYADESLFISKIRPTRKMRTLSQGESKQLLSAIQKTLRTAIRLGGSSIEYFLMTNGASGKFTEEHLVYGKAGEPCPECGEPLSTMKIGSRTTVFCRTCQH